jgi:uncharacterized damage-inducible protein DinB
MITLPQPDEYAPFYANYIQKAAAQGDVMETLVKLKDSTYHFFLSIPPGKENYAYAEGKWTIKQLISHLIDAERVFAYRLLRISRQDQTNLPGFDENLFVDNTDLNARTVTYLAEEFKAVREANLYLYQSITEKQSFYSGICNNQPVSVRALLYIAAGHELHHLDILRERYLS